MRNAVILNYADGTIDILPIPDEIPEDKECEYVEGHPAYRYDECAYMLAGEEIEVRKVTSDRPTYELHDTLYL